MDKSDLIIRSNAIFKGHISKPAGGFVAVKGNRIQYVGDDMTLLHEYTGRDTEVYDVGDCLVMPGFCDAHLHFYLSALYMSPYICVSLADKSEEQCVASLASGAEYIPKDRWLIGAGWYHPLWDNPVLPTKASLDEAYPDRPVCMISQDCHTLWFNSEGLRRVGITKDSVPSKGSYEHYEDGEPTGITHDGASTMLLRQIFDFTQEEENLFCSAFVKTLNSYGITSVCDMSLAQEEGADFVREDIYERLLGENKLTVRINMYPTLLDSLTRILDLREKFDGDILRCQGAKQFMDGVSSCHTAYLKEDYSNAAFEGDRGYPTMPVGEMRNLILKAIKNDISVRIHTIGDQAIHELLDIFEKGEEIYGYKPYLQHTLEHLENFQKEDIGRLAKLHVLPSVQPAHALLDTEGVERDLGRERAKLMWPFRSLADSGATLAFGTDSPVVEINPFYGIYNAVTRKSAYDCLPGEGWQPEERISLAEALSFYTYGGACAASRSHELGIIAPGMLADIAVLDRNIFERDPEELLDTKVLMTVMNGKTVYHKGVVKAG